jgi:hypothetical protein
MKKVLASLLIVFGLAACNEADVNDGSDRYVAPQKLLEQLIDEGVTIELDNAYFAKEWDVSVISLDSETAEDDYQITMNADGKFDDLVTPFFAFEAKEFDHDEVKQEFDSFFTLAPDGETAYYAVDGGVNDVFDIYLGYELVDTGFDVYLKIIKSWNFYRLCMANEVDTNDCEEHYQEDPSLYAPVEEDFTHSVKIAGANEQGWAVEIDKKYYLLTPAN